MMEGHHLGLTKEVFHSSLWEPEGGPTSCIPYLWAFCTPGGCGEAKSCFGFLRLVQPTLLGICWDMKCVVGRSKLWGHQGLSSEACFVPA